MEIKLDTTGIKDIERDGGITLEEMAYQVNITVRQSRQSGVARATCPD